MTATATKPKTKAASVTQAVDAKRRARREEALRFYRQSVFAEANGESAPAKGVDEVVELMQELALPVNAFAADFETAQLDATYIESLKDSGAKLAALIAETEPIPAKIFELRQQIAGLERQERAAHHGMRSIYNQRQQHEHLRACNPRLFSDNVDVALGPQPGAFDPRAIFAVKPWEKQ